MAEEEVDKYFITRDASRQSIILTVTKNECPHCGGKECIVDNQCQMPDCGEPVIYNVKEFEPRKLTVEEATEIARIKVAKEQAYGKEKDPTKDDLWAEIARLKEQVRSIQSGEPEPLPGYMVKLLPPKSEPAPKKEVNTLPEDQGDPFADF